MIEIPEYRERFHAVSAQVVDSMNIAIVHYHLNHGGVTQVIANQLRALDGAGTRADRLRVGRALWRADRRLARRAGRPPGLDGRHRRRGCRTRLRRAPGGRAPRLAASCAAQLADARLSHLTRRSSTCTITAWARTPPCPAPCDRLADDGFALLLQIHDFAEDCRPTQLRPPGGGMERRRTLPRSCIRRPRTSTTPCSIAATGTSCRRAGVPSERLHYLPNPLANHAVSGPIHTTLASNSVRRFGIPTTARFLLYPGAARFAARTSARRSCGRCSVGPATHVGVDPGPAQSGRADLLPPLETTGTELPAARPLRDRRRARAALRREPGVRRLDSDAPV